MREFGALAARIYGLLNRNSAINGMIIDIAALAPEDRALEVGCGPGTAVAIAADRIGAEQVAAVDPSPTFVDMVRRKVPGTDVRVSGAEDVPFEDGSFTVIWALASMHHWSDREAGLSTLTSKLAPGGRLLLAERLLKRPGHGITPEQVTAVMTRLTELGHTDVHTTECRSGRKTITTIHASRS